MKLHGVLPPATTPFRNGEIDLDAFRANIDRWMTTYLAGVVVLGSNGEAAQVTDEEADALIGAARERVPADRQLIAGTARESTKGTIDATRRAAALGADAALVRTPSFFKPQMTGEALAVHFEAVADASPIPILLYNFTAVTGVNLAVATVARLASHPNIIGMKESGGDVAQIAELVAGTPPEFGVYAGSAPSFYPSLCIGACGGILALACAAPEPCLELYRLTCEGEHARARALQTRLTPLARAVTSMYGVAGLKAAMECAGYVGGEPRAPLRPLTPAARDDVRARYAALLG